jgi:hypothetical protein
VALSPKKRSTSVCRAEGGDGELIAAIKERRWRDGAPWAARAGACAIAEKLSDRCGRSPTRGYEARAGPRVEPAVVDLSRRPAIKRLRPVGPESQRIPGTRIRKHAPDHGFPPPV